LRPFRLVSGPPKSPAAKKVGALQQLQQGPEASLQWPWLLLWHAARAALRGVQQQRWSKAGMEAAAGVGFSTRLSTVPSGLCFPVPAIKVSGKAQVLALLLLLPQELLVHCAPAPCLHSSCRSLFSVCTGCGLSGCGGLGVRRSARSQGNAPWPPCPCLCHLCRFPLPHARCTPGARDLSSQAVMTVMDTLTVHAAMPVAGTGDGRRGAASSRGCVHLDKP